MSARLALALAAASLIAGSALALGPAAGVLDAQGPHNETIIEMNELWPITSPVTDADCTALACDGA